MKGKTKCIQMYHVIKPNVFKTQKLIHPNMQMTHGQKHTRVSQFWEIRVPFQSPFLL
jgi:hypothetical protein